MKKPSDVTVLLLGSIVVAAFTFVLTCSHYVYLAVTGGVTGPIVYVLGVFYAAMFVCLIVSILYAFE